jgi:quinol monooxygenase YgiN
MTVAKGDMIIAIVAIRASSGKRDELRRALSSLSGPAEAEPGCTSWQLFQEVSDSNMLRVESRWKTQSDLFRHIRSDAYKKFLLLMELGAEPPTIEFYAVSELRGLDLIKAARQLSD